MGSAHPLGDIRDCGLVVAEACAIGATVFDPENHFGSDRVDDIESLRANEGQLMPSLNGALSQFDNRAAALFDVDDVAEAAAAENEASHLFEGGYYHLAFALVDRALILRIWTVGKNALPTLATQNFKSTILLALGHGEEALPIACAVAEA